MFNIEYVLQGEKMAEKVEFMRIEDIEKAIGVKKRTIIFWLEEYQLGDLYHHSNGGNLYPVVIVDLLALICKLKSLNWYSSSFIKTAIAEIRKNGFSSLMNLEFQVLAHQGIVSEFQDRLDSIEPDTKALLIKAVESQKAVEKIPEIPEEKVDFDALFAQADMANKSGDSLKAKELFQRLICPESPYSEIAKIVLEILG